jgi:ribosomal protein S1
VRKVLDYGAFVEIETGIDGFIHVSEMSEERIDDPRKILKPGQKLRAEIIAVDPEDRKIALSLKAAQRSEELADLQGFKGVSGVQATLGDVLKDKLGNMVDSEGDAEKAPQTEAAEDTEEAKPAEDTEKAKPAEDTEEAKPAEDTEKAKTAEDTEEAKPAEDTEKAKPAEDTEEAKPAEDTEEAKPAEDTEKAKPAEDTEEAKPAEDTEKAKTAEEPEEEKDAEKAAAKDSEEAKKDE